MNSSVLGNMLTTDRENWWDKSNTINRLDGQQNNHAVANNQSGTQVSTNTSGGSFTRSLENILARSDTAAANDGMGLSQAAPSSVSGEAVTFEELINSQNAQIREFAVLDQQPVVSEDWNILGNTSPVTPSNFSALNGLGDNLLLSQRFANAIVAV